MNKTFDSFDLDVISVFSTQIDLENCKLNPSFYSSNQKFINELKTKPLSHFCEEIFNPPVFKREFINDSNECRYLQSAEISVLEPEMEYITNDQSERLNLKVKMGCILITGFGTIGNIRIVDDLIENFAVANNVTRIIPKQDLIGFVAAFLESSYGNSLLNDSAAGATVKYIEAPQIAKIPIPILSDGIISETNKLYLSAVKCREDCHKLLERARTLVLQYNNLPLLKDTELETLDPDKETDLRFVSTEEFTDDYRLDAHFYNPIADLAVRNIREHAKNIKPLYKVSDCSYRGGRSARNYVDKEHGIPFLSGKNIIQIRPDLKYISKTETSNLDEKLIYRNWILITRSGTLGRTVFVYKNYEEYAASEHLIRVIPFEQEIDQAYIYAFLSSNYGYHQLIRCKHGAVIDEITEDQISQSIIPLPNKEQQKEIGNFVRKAYDLRAEAICLEDKAQEILTKELTRK